MKPVFSVTELHEMLNMHLALLGEITIEGEISEIKPSGTQWLYLTLKDSTAVIKLFATQWDIRNWKSLDIGMKVHATGVARTYAPYGTLSVSVSSITPAGEGAMKQAFEKLKAQLDLEGLFDESRKRELPAFPTRIGLITARGSQAYNDFTKVLQNRMGGLHVYFLPTQVQGEASPALLCQSIQHFNSTMPDLDVLIICRGGGSLEDLQAFNDEGVARAIFASHIPVISGVGHEGDVTLADLVADVRASTPSNAAELLVRERDTVVNRLDNLVYRMQQAVRSELTHKKHYVQTASTRIQHLLMQNIQQVYHHIDDFYRVVPTIKGTITAMTVRQESLARLLNNLDPTTILAKGFAIARSADGAIVRSIMQARPADSLTLEVTDGTIYTHVQSTGTKNR